MYKFDFITDWETIWSDDFQNQWLKWIEDSEEANIFFHPEFVKVWIETYKPIRDIKPIFCIAKDEQNNIVFLPLVLWSKNWKNAFEKVIVPVGYSDYDYHDPLVFGEIDYETFIQELIIEINTKFKFDYFLTDDIRSLINTKKVALINNIEAPFIELDKFNSFEDYLSFVSKSTRKEYRKNNKNLNELGNLEFKCLNKNDALNTMDKMLAVHTLRYPNAYKAPNFHKNILNILMEKNLIHFSVILINEKIISWRIGFIFKNRYYSYMPIFENDYSNYSVSKLHMIYVIEDLIQKKFKIFDLMRGAKDYKKSFATNTKELYSYKFSEYNFFTKLKQVALDVKSKIK